MSDVPGGGATRAGPPGSLPPPPHAGETRWRNGSGTAALVIGVVSLVLAILVIFAPVGALLGVIGAVFGVIGLVRVNHGLANNRGHAVGGLVTALLGLLIGVSITVSAGGFLATHWNDLRTFARCLDGATGEQARDVCAQQFAEKVR
jgi:hypothetical protein